MYLPHGMPTCYPHVASWIGESGRRYDFVVARPNTLWVDEPAVYVLARRCGGQLTPLCVGQTRSLQSRFGISNGRCPEDWGRALAMGMTHVHVRFEACSDHVRQSEARDLVAALRPALNGVDARDAKPADSVDTGVSAGEERAVRRRATRRPRPAEPAPLPIRVAAVEPPAPPPSAAATIEAPAPTAGPIPSTFDAAPAADPAPAAAVETSTALPPRMTSDEVAAALLGDLTPTAEAPPGGGWLARVSRRLSLRRLIGFGGHPVAATASPEGDVLAVPAPAPELSSAAAPALDVAADVATAAVVEPAIALVDPSPPAAAAAPAIALAAASTPTAAPEPAVAPEPPAAPEPAVATADDRAAERAEARRALGIADAVPVGLFAGSLSHAAGADILAEALLTVCRDDREACFVFAGDGPLRGDLETRMQHSGVGARCRFLGDVAARDFERVLLASDYAIVPGRAPQGDGFARLAIEHGLPVLATHQSQVGVVQHGRTGLVTYDNPGSLVWGIRELLGPLRGDMRRNLAKAA